MKPLKYRPIKFKEIKNQKNVYYFEMTDLYCGELNYTWLHRFKIESTSSRGAISKLSKEVGFNFKNIGLYYKAKKAHVAAYEVSQDMTDQAKKSWEDSAKFL